MLREFLGIRTEEETAAAARWIRSKQRADGTWANFHGGPGDLSTTVEAYVALRLAGDAPGRAAHGAGGRLDPRPGRHRGHPGVHPDLAGDVRPVVMGRPAGHPAGADLPAGLVPAERLRLGVLGAADDRPARGGRVDAAVAAAAVLALRAADRIRPRSGGIRGLSCSTGWTTDAAGTEFTGAPACRTASAARVASCEPRPQRVRRLRCGGAPSGSSRGRRRTGAGAGFSRPGCTRCSRCTARGTGSSIRSWRAAWPGWTGSRSPRTGRTGSTAAGGVPVAGVGHRAGDGGTRGCRPKPDDPVWPAARVDARRGDHRPGRLAGQAAWHAPGGWAFEFDNDGYPDTDDTAEVLLALAEGVPDVRLGRQAGAAAARRPVAERDADRGRRLGGVRR